MEVTWNLATFAAADAQRRILQVTAPSLPSNESSALIHATADLTYDGGYPVDAVAEHTVKLVQDTGPLLLSVTKSATSVTSPGSLTYTITLDNTSNNAVNNVSVLLRNPEQIQFNRLTASPLPATGCTNNVCVGGLETRWDFASVPAGPGAAQIILTVDVQSGYGIGTLINAPISVVATEQTNPINIVDTTPVK